MQDAGLATPESALAEGRCTAAPPKRPQDSAQTVRGRKSEMALAAPRIGAHPSRDNVPPR